MTRRANAIDFWRGFALVTIFINHIPGIYFERFTFRNVSISDSAELFVFLAGWSLRYVVGRPEDPTPTAHVLSRLTGRALTIYAAHILIISLAIAMLAASAIATANPLLLEWHNASAVFSDPVRAHVGIVLLTHHLGYFDILPLYVVLMLAAPLVALIHRGAPGLLLPISLAIYVTALVFQITLPSWPNRGQWFFNPLAWQLVFVLGFLMARERGPGAMVRANLSWLRWISLPIVLAGAVIVWFGLWPDPTRVPEPKLLFIAQKAYLTPMRLIQFLALVALFSAAYPYIERRLLPLVRYLAMLGRNSLQVFCVGSLLSLAGQIARFMYKGGIVVDALILITGILAMGLTAWLTEWRSRNAPSR